MLRVLTKSVCNKLKNQSSKSQLKSQKFYSFALLF